MFKIGTVYRTASGSSYKDPTVDGLPNYYYETHVDGFDYTFAFQKGIHRVKSVKTPDGNCRCPVIIISSSPHKAGSEDTPWQDKYDPDRGFVRYYGDNKTANEMPEDRGNKHLLKLLPIYESEDKKTRMAEAIPIVFFERTSHNGRVKGNLKFQGFGILERAELVTQYDVTKNEYFANYLFQFCVFTMKCDGEAFNWNWIAKRCDPSLTDEETNKFAPDAWKIWVDNGKTVLHKIRRSVSIFDIVKKDAQIPKDKSKEESLLLDIYHYYDGRKHLFEYLAMEVTKIVIESTGASCVPGWITKKSGDGGIDFVLRIDIGKDTLSGLKIIVLGQAKCTQPNNCIDGKDIARTVARLKRGWVGAFVTTSFYSVPMQQEMNEDKYPIMLINGRKLAEIVGAELFKKKIDLNTYLSLLENKYTILKKMAEDIMYE